MLAIKHALANYRKIWKNSQHFRVKSDNTTAIAYVSNMGGIAGLDKLCAHKSIRTLLSSTWMLFKVGSCFCV